MTRAGGPALLFEHPKGSRVPLLINALGSERRIQLALEVDAFEEVAERIRGFLDMQAPQGLLDKIKMLPKLAELGSFFPKTVKIGPVQGSDAARELLAAGVSDFAMLAAGCGAVHHLAAGDHAQSGDGQAQRGRLSHAGVRRDAPRACTGRRKSTARSIFAGRARPIREGRIEVAVAIGADPVTCLAGILPIPPDLDEMMFAGFLRREPVEMVPCETCSLEVPAQAEIVLEGYVDLSEMRTEGPFGDHTGFYSLEGEYPVFPRHLRDPPARSAST